MKYTAEIDQKLYLDAMIECEEKRITMDQLIMESLNIRLARYDYMSYKSTNIAINNKIQEEKKSNSVKLLNSLGLLHKGYYTPNELIGHINKNTELTIESKKSLGHKLRWLLMRSVLKRDSNGTVQRVYFISPELIEIRRKELGYI